MFKKWMTVFSAALCMLSIHSASAEVVEVQAAQGWLTQFSEALPQFQMLNDPLKTADPARAGEYLIEYPFGTVMASSAYAPDAKAILEIDIRSEQVTDCRGMHVGMTLNEAMQGMTLPQANGTQLAVLDLNEAQAGWSWVYLDQQGVYGLEFVSYDMSDPAVVTEYTLTYVIDENGRVSAIRMKMAPSSQAQAESGVRTAQEISSRQAGEALAQRNGERMLEPQDLTVMGMKALSVPVYDLVSMLGEPLEVQQLPSGGGRILLYEGAAVLVGLDVQTSAEIVKGLTVTGTGLTGPRGIQVGMSVQEAASLYRCDADVYGRGGTLYLEGEAYGEAPFGEIRLSASGEAQMRYACLTDSGETAWLEAGIENGSIAYWHIFEGNGDMENGI